MNKEDFLRGLNDPKEITTNDLDNLVEASREYPYCQNLHLLIAKKYQDINHPKASVKLHTAAIYAPDRHLLKKLIEDDPSYISSKKNFHQKYNEAKVKPLLTEVLPAEELEEKDLATKEIQVVENFPVSLPKFIISTRFIDSRINQLEEVEVEEYTQNAAELKETENQQIEELSKASENNIYDDLEKTLQEYKKRKDETGSKSDYGNVQSIKTPGPKETLEETFQEKIDKALETSDTEIAEAESLKKEEKKETKIEIEDSEDLLLNEQNQIIENFIKLNPTLSRFDLKFDEDHTTVEDLSIPKLIIGEHLVSENLAILLHKQGKVKKAVDVYEKLILKFPEKKAYFASCIEKIKKSK